MSATRAQSEKDKGNAAFKAGDYPTAIGHYSAAVVADPQSPTYPLNRAAAYLKLGKNEDAERDCTTVLRLDAKNVKAMFRRGQARVALERLKEARDDFQKALVLEPSNDAVKQELKKAEDALKAHSKPRAVRMNLLRAKMLADALAEAPSRRQCGPRDIRQTKATTQAHPNRDHRVARDCIDIHQNSNRRVK